MISPDVSYRCILGFPLILILTELSDQRGGKGSGTSEEDLWLLLAIPFGIVSVNV